MRRPAFKTAAKKPTKPRRRTAVAQHKTSRPEQYVLTEKECELAETYRKRRDDAAPALRFKVNCDNNRDARWLFQPSADGHGRPRKDFIVNQAIYEAP